MKCQDFGGILAYEGFNNQTAYNLIYSGAIDPHWSSGSINFGAFFPTPRGDLYDLSGKIISWDNFASGEPNNADGNCVRICVGSHGRKWCDNSCNKNVKRAICQKPKGKFLLTRRTYIAISAFACACLHFFYFVIIWDCWRNA